MREIKVIWDRCLRLVNLLAVAAALVIGPSAVALTAPCPFDASEVSLQYARNFFTMQDYKCALEALQLILESGDKYRHWRCEGLFLRSEILYDSLVDVPRGSCRDSVITAGKAAFRECGTLRQKPYGVEPEYWDLMVEAKELVTQQLLIDQANKDAREKAVQDSVTASQAQSEAVVPPSPQVDSSNIVEDRPRQPKAAWAEELVRLPGEIGIAIGIVRSGQSWKPDPAELQPVHSLMLEIQVDWTPKEKLAWVSELAFVQKGAIVGYGNSSFEDQLTYVSLNFLARYRWVGDRTNTPYIVLGPGLSYKVGRHRIEVYLGERFKRVVLGFEAGLGISLQRHKNYSPFVELRYSRDLHNSSTGGEIDIRYWAAKLLFGFTVRD